MNWHVDMNEIARVARIAGCFLCVACVSSQTIRPDALAGHPLELSEGVLVVDSHQGDELKIKAPVTLSTLSGRLVIDAAGHTTHSFALRELDGLTVKTPSPGRTALLVPVILAGIFFAAFAIVALGTLATQPLFPSTNWSGGLPIGG